MKTILFFFTFLCLTTSAYCSPTPSEIQVKAAVLEDLIHAADPTADNAYGLDLPQNQLTELEQYLKGKVRLLTVKNYVHKYENSGRDLVSTCFWIKVSSLTPTQATVSAGLYPLEVKTKFGLMPANTTDFVYHLAQKNGHWVVVSSDISGAS